MAKVTTKTDRELLTPRREPYWTRLTAGGQLGFRAGSGTWIAKHRDPTTGERKIKALGEAQSDSRRTGLTHDQAASQARAWFVQLGQGITADITVKIACENYIAGLVADARLAAAKDATGRFNRLIYDETIGRIKLADLRQDHVKNWRADQIRGKAAGEDLRKAKDSANRNMASLKAALNAAYKARAVVSDFAWATVDPFPKAGQRRQDAFLSAAQRAALLKACPPDLALLVKAALLTGFRPGELASLNAGDLITATGTIRVSGKVGFREVPLSSPALSFFKELSRDKMPLAPILTRADGKRWSKDWWKKLFTVARDAAKLPATVVLYSLRHTGISEMIMSGMDSLAVASITGTSVAMIEKNYGHLSKQHLKVQLDRVQIL